MTNLNENEFIVDDGLRRYTFKNLQGEVFGELLFNAADTNLVDRYKKIVEHFRTEGTEEHDSEEMDDDKYLEFINKTEDDIMEQFNVLCGRNVSEDLFGTYRPCTVFGTGDMYAEWLIETMGTIIERELDVRLESKKAKIKKALRK